MSRAPSVRATPAGRRAWLAPLAVAIITIVVFLPALKGGFVSWDDDKNFVENFQYRGLGVEQLRWMWTTFHLGHWVPLTWMTLGFDHLIWGMDPFGYHLTNVALHAATAVAVFAVARRVLAQGFPEEAKGVNVAAAMTALLFALHPLRVESVAWITERRDVLSGFFYFTAIAAYLRSLGDDPARLKWYLTSLALFVLAILAKGSAVTLPAALLLLSVFPFRRLGGAAGWTSPSARQVYLELLPFGVVALVATALTFTALQPVEQLPPEGKLAASFYSLAFYLTKTIVPTGLSPLYVLPRELNPLDARYLLGAGLVVATTGTVLALRRRIPALAAAWLTFAVVLLPFLGVHQNGPQIVADRYSYNASVALALLVGAGILTARGGRRTVAIALAAVVLAALSALTTRQIGIWRDSLTLWSRVVEVEPESAIGNNNLGNVLANSPRASEAMARYEAAIRADPLYPDAHNNLGVELSAAGRAREAVDHFRRAVELRPDYADALGNLGASLAALGDVEGALQSYAAAAAADSTNSAVQLNWANALVRSGRLAEAEPHYAEAVRLRPDKVIGYINWGLALAQAGRLREAEGHLERALTLEPGHADARRSLDMVREELASDSLRLRRKSR